MLNLIVVISITCILQSCKNTQGPDFEKLIKKYSIHKSDSLKLQSVLFIRDNISDITSEQVSFYGKGDSEIQPLDTITSDSSLRKVLAVNNIIFRTKIINDSKYLSTELLDENIDKAIADWKKYPWNKDVPKDIFLNYLLPYKVLNENPDNWRIKLFQKYQDSIIKHEINKDINSENLYSGLRNEAWSWLKYTGDFTKLTQSPSLTELLAVKKGQCYELSHLFVYIARSAGIPATIDLVPMWGKMNGSHAAEVFYGPIKESNAIKKKWIKTMGYF